MGGPKNAKTLLVRKQLKFRLGQLSALSMHLLSQNYLNVTDINNHTYVSAGNFSRGTQAYTICTFIHILVYLVDTGLMRFIACKV